MSLRSRLSIAVAAGALAVTALGTPAVAGDDWDGSDGDWGNQQDQTQNQGEGQGQGQGQFQGQGQGQNQDPGHHQTQNQNQTQNQTQQLYKGVVTASSLALRSAPNRGGQIIRWADNGDSVRIFCKTGGQNIDGNSTWYLLTDGTWAWGAARYIHVFGATPRWC
ncbi:SH3 domain-containing protein [Streptomyces sp. NBC_00285]|uniref:SH3 domain-containing protein n=1 Tax=Streptomyces sp. NBC_00285 TaxID=2975700 RepID=UPI002E2C3B18|nr:SH3 domain-containing protein [Streptomyces sp. NBC_00285]